ncbi:MAG: type II secretion system F family protein [Methanobacterium sp.]|uniref:type II secretion system F family protein n=1 Tax=Methanobacterium sp. TaxID=2164 RepID=UPI003D64E94D|nr:type II secretion system F family protein [Methanobacterium sp.]
MAFEGLKNIFNKIGGITVNSGKKVGEGVQKPVGKLSKIRPPSRPGFSKSSVKSSVKPSKTSPRVIERMKMDKDEIQMFKELIDKKYERQDKKSDVDKEKRDVYKKAALEELLKEEEKEGMDPKLIMGMGAVSFVVILILMTALGFGIEIGLVFGLLVFLMAGVILFLPRLQKGKKSSEASRELPFALRQMATELRAGLGLHESMRSIALSGYGALSEEFARTLEEIKYGETTENALIDMGERINSEGMTRAVYQITRTLASGGDLSRTLNVIAEDIAYELRMKLKDYAQKLNSFTMIYMFVAVLGPVILMIMLIAASTVMGPMFPPIVLLILYLFLFPLIVGFLAFMIKRLEPQI